MKAAESEKSFTGSNYTLPGTRNGVLLSRCDSDPGECSPAMQVAFTKRHAITPFKINAPDIAVPFAAL